MGNLIFATFVAALLVGKIRSLTNRIIELEVDLQYTHVRMNLYAKNRGEVLPYPELEEEDEDTK